MSLICLNVTDLIPQQMWLGLKKKSLPSNCLALLTLVLYVNPKPGNMPGFLVKMVVCNLSSITICGRPVVK